MVHPSTAALVAAAMSLHATAATAGGGPAAVHAINTHPAATHGDEPPGAAAAATVQRRLSVSTLLSHLDSVSSQINSELFLYQTPSYQWIPSEVYRYDDFRESIDITANEGVANKKLYVGDDVTNGHVLGLVNLAAFLAQSMKETIQYDACDENSWDFVNGKYPLSNACGQLGQSYQDYHCPDHERHMECDVDPDMSITAVTHAKWYGAPGPLFCGPKSEYPTTGFWDHGYECNKAWMSPPETCDVYEGQKAGRYDNSIKYASTGGRTDVEGCCWWGRGVIQTTGVCNFGKLNYFLGARAKKDGRPARYPKVDFCKDPEIICASPEHKELKWIAGEFYWMESVQSYKADDGWDYLTELRKYVQGGMVGTAFIDAVSGIVNRGCHNPPCGTGPVDGTSERAENFHKVLDVFFGDSPPEVGDLSSLIGVPETDSNPASPAGATASGAGSVASGNGSNAPGKWYPDYNAQYALGKCVDDIPAPSGRPAYDSGEECCNQAYGGQASGACLASLPGKGKPDSNASPGVPDASSALVSSPGTPADPPAPVTSNPTPPPVPLSPEAAAIVSSTTFVELQNTLEGAKDDIDNEIFLYQTPDFQWIPSSVYRYEDFRESLNVMATDGVAGKKFYIGEPVENGHVFGLVNIAAFLAQSMKETIQYDACDENSWDLVSGKYPLSNACGQLGQSYQDYHCPEHEKHMECAVDPDMSIKAVTHAKWYGAPGPLFCGPKSEYPSAGIWDHSYECNKAWASPPETCDVYEGQKAGRYDTSVEHANTGGRTDVEGCCWWGRGVIQTTGVCNFGKLNYYLGARAKKDGRPSRYPEVDFCKDPEVICASSEHKELKWLAGEFYWTESVQSYNEGGWDYTTELEKFVRGGMTGTSFIDAVSGIVNRGCHNPPCGTGPVDGSWERAENFKKVLEVFFGGSPPAVGDAIPDDPAGATSEAFATPETSVASPITPGPTKQPVSPATGDPPAPDTPKPTRNPTSEPTDQPVSTTHEACKNTGSCGGTDSSPGSAATGKWYPDYNAQYALGKCVNNAPAPNGRPSYDSGEECCNQAYAYQASGACLASLPDAAPSLDGSPSDSVPSPDKAHQDTTIEASSTLISSPGTPADPPAPVTSNPTPPPVHLSPEAAAIIGSPTFVELENTLESAKDDIDNKIFLYQTPDFQWVASSVYRYEDFRESLNVMATDGVAGKKFYIGEPVENGHVFGLVNIAAFLAQSMKETIQYDACDENSWDLVNGKYPLSNACGQLGQSYQDYHCPEHEKHMECPVDPDMSIKAVTHAKWYGAPGPLFCGPKSEYPSAGIWDHSYGCNKAWASPPETCDVYEGQKAGRYDTSIEHANTGGRTDVEGCCWWGRGVIQTTGVCNFGKLNYYLGARAKKDGRPSRYPEVDFCKDPEVICASSEHKELKWLAGEFYWTESVQSYNEGGWDYTTELEKFVRGGMKGTSFIDAVSGIVNRGCHNPPCGTGPVDGSHERAENFKKVLEVFFGGSPPVVGDVPVSSLPGAQSALTTHTETFVSPADTPDESQSALATPHETSFASPDAPVESSPSSMSGGPADPDSSLEKPGPTVWRPENADISVMGTQDSTPDPVPSFDTPGSTVWRPEAEDITMAEAFIAGTLCDTYQCRRNSNFIAYKCGSTNNIPDDSLVLDILFDYEVTVPPTADTDHVLRELKRQILENLAETIGCQAFSLSRNLRTNGGNEVLLGYHSAQGSDVIDNEKGACSVSPEVDGTKCVPVIGHLAAFIRQDTTVDLALATKDGILNALYFVVAGNDYSRLAKNIVFVGKHVGMPTQLVNNRSFGEGSAKSGKAIPIAVTMTLLAIIIGVAIFVVHRKRKMSRELETPESDDKDDESSQSSLGQTDTRMSGLDNSQWSEGPRMGNSFEGRGTFNANHYHDGSSAIPTNLDASDDTNIHADQEAQATTESYSEPGTAPDHNEHGFTHENDGVNFVLVDNESSYDYGHSNDVTAAQNVAYDYSNDVTTAQNIDYGYSNDGTAAQIHDYVYSNDGTAAQNDDYVYSNDGTATQNDDYGVVSGMPFDNMYYTGQIHPETRLPHGLGTLRSNDNGAIHEGEWRFGELVSESGPVHQQEYPADNTALVNVSDPVHPQGNWQDYLVQDYEGEAQGDEGDHYEQGGHHEDYEAQGHRGEYYEQDYYQPRNHSQGQSQAQNVRTFSQGDVSSSHSGWESNARRRHAEGNDCASYMTLD